MPTPSLYTPPTEASGCFRQPTEALGMNDSGVRHCAVIYKGPYDTLEANAKTIKVGTEVVDGMYAQEWQLDRAPGDTGVLTIDCLTYTTETAGEGQTPTAKCLDDLWEVRSVRNDLSIFAYCGNTTMSDTEAHRSKIEAWMKEPDGDLADRFMYRISKDEVGELVGGCRDVAQKIAEGKEAVIRFYAALTRTRTYDTPPDCLEHLAEINTPDTSAIPDAPTHKPSNLEARLAQYQWLKMQDDAIQQPDKTWKRIESWWGILKTDANNGSPWDADLYGDPSTRWKMPHLSSGTPPSQDSNP